MGGVVVAEGGARGVAMRHTWLLLPDADNPSRLSLKPVQL